MVECSGKSSTLIEKLQESKSLICQSCNKLLQIPVVLVKGVGNVCENCTLQYEWKGIDNKIFNVLLQELIIPCANKIVGCSEQIAHEHFEQHLLICKFRPVKCPHEGCKSMEIQDNLSRHLLENHKENVIESDAFKFKLNYQEPLRITKLFVKRNLSFLFVVKVEADKMVCTLFKFQKNAPCSTTITFCNDAEQEYSFRIDINPLDLIGRECSVGTVSLALLKTMFKENNVVSMIVNIPPSDRTLQSLKCPICDKLMKPPIFLCTNGHTLCNNCVSQEKKCPTCYAAIGKRIRNYHLESSTKNMFYSCAYKKSGCCAVLSGDEIMDHESNCSYRLHKCFKCHFEYNSITVLNHLSVEHPSVTNKFEFDCEYGKYDSLSNNDARSLLYIDGKFFLFKYILNPLTKPKDNMDWTLLRLELLNTRSRTQVKDLCCKITMTNSTAQATVGQLWLLNDSTRQHTSVHKCYSILIPIQSWKRSVDTARNNHEVNAHLQFKCELFKN